MDLRAALLQRYPGLKASAGRYDVRQGDALEYYPEGESESPDQSRRVIDAPRGTSADDLAGEMVSHDLAQGGDPQWTAAYRQFQRGMTPDQQRALQEQYQWAQANEGETRPFAQWLKHTGQPAYFRGNLFHQWPDAFYTSGQRSYFDKLRSELLTRANPAH